VRRVGRQVIVEPADEWTPEFLACLGAWDEERSAPVAPGPWEFEERVRALMKYLLVRRCGEGIGDGELCQCDRLCSFRTMAAQTRSCCEPAPGSPVPSPCVFGATRSSIDPPSAATPRTKPLQARLYRASRPN